MVTKKQKFFIALLAQLLIIGLVIVSKLLILSGGGAVLLRVVPVDPRDPLRGDYVTLRYNISTLDGYRATSLMPVEVGDIVYVTLEKSSDTWYAQSASKEKPTSDEVFIRGVVTQARSSGVQGVVLEFGIEQYFIPENSGKNLRITNYNTVAGVVVDDEGRAVLKQLYVDGKLWP